MAYVKGTNAKRRATIGRGNLRSRVPTHVGGRRLSRTTVQPRDSSLKIDYRPWEKMFLHKLGSPPGLYVGLEELKIQCAKKSAPSR